jgi:hypothetical protein
LCVRIKIGWTVVVKQRAKTANSPLGKRLPLGAGNICEKNKTNYPYRRTFNSPMAAVGSKGVHWNFVRSFEYGKTRLAFQHKIVLPATRQFPGVLTIKNENPLVVKAQFLGDSGEDSC